MFGLLSGMLKRSLPQIATEVYKIGMLDQFMHFIEGRRGKGKSYALSAVALEAFKNQVPVRSNFTLNLPLAANLLVLHGIYPHPEPAMEWLLTNWGMIETWDDIFSCTDSIILFDEAAQIMDARAKDTPQEFIEWGRQSRKMGVTLYFASQSMEFVDFRYRRLVDVLWYARRVDLPKSKTGGKRIPEQFFYYGFDPYRQGFTSEVQREQADFRFALKFSPQISKLYDTYEAITPAHGSVDWRTVAEQYKRRREAAAAALKRWVTPRLNSHLDLSQLVVDDLDVRY